MGKFAVLVLLLVVVSMAGCRMFKGAGQDIKSGSDATSDKIHDIIH
jgi:predicted small secreted protein